MLALDGAMWRGAARWGANGPAWLVRSAPPLVALAIFAASRRHRRTVVDNLRRIRGPRGRVRDSMDAARTFANYAACLAEVLGSRKGIPPRATILGEAHLGDAIADGKGILVVTAHTGGWELAGPLLARDEGSA